MSGAFALAHFPVSRVRHIAHILASGIVEAPQAGQKPLLLIGTTPQEKQLRGLPTNSVPQFLQKITCLLHPLLKFALPQANKCNGEYPENEIATDKRTDRPGERQPPNPST